MLPDIEHVKTRDYGNIRVEKRPYAPPAVSRSAFERGLTDSDRAADAMIRELYDKCRPGDWLLHNLQGEENVFRVEGVEHFPVKVRILAADSEGHDCSRFSIRYMSSGSVGILVRDGRARS